jgi:hypothetical protein
MRLRQVALVARDLEATVDDLRAVFDLEVAFRDPGVAAFGLVNAVLAVGDTFLEVVSPVRDDASAARLLARRGGDAGYMVIVQTEDLAAARERMRREKVRIVFEHTHPAGHTATIHLHPSDVGGAILSLDESKPAASWDWAGPDWERHAKTRVVSALAAATLASDDPAGLAAHWGSLLDCTASALGGGVFVIELDRSALRFVPAEGRGDGFVGVDLLEAGRAARGPALMRARERGLRVDGDAIWIAGTALRLVDAATP